MSRLSAVLIALTRGWTGWGLRLLVSVALLAWLLRQIQGGWEELGSVRVGDLWPAAAAFAASTVLGALQWTLILRRAGVGVSVARMQALYWIGLFFNNFLPSNVGGDVVKVADLAVDTGRWMRPLAGTLLDRMLGLNALVGVAFAGGLILGGSAPAGIPWWALALLALPTLGLSAALLSGRLGRMVVAVARRVLPRGSAKLEGIVGELAAYRADPAFVLRLALLAVVVQSLRVATHVAVAQAMGVPLTTETVLGLYVLVPILGVAIVLPLSFNGLGVREFVATRLMPEIGIGAPVAFALQVTTYFVQVGVSLVGGVIFAVLFLRGRLVRARPVS